VLPLTSHPLQLAVLSSGSKGNCTWIGDSQYGLLIDCGPSSKRIFELMASVGLEDAPIDAVLITHEHSDHVGSARILHNKLKKKTGRSVPFYMTQGTLDGALVMYKSSMQASLLHMALSKSRPFPYLTMCAIPWPTGSNAGPLLLQS
jgi:glyoxylase-like metal-dependent hydrolase (beta-lactamase superfamily II)